MNKIKLLLSLSLFLGLVACESNTNQEDNPPEIVNQLDRTQADYTIEEIKLPDEFTEELIAEIAMPFGKFIEIFHEEGYHFKLTLNDARKSRLCPVDVIYDYDLLANELTLIDPPIEVDMYRMASHVVDELGGEYDLIEYIDNGQRYKRVFYNGKLVEGIENTIDNPFYSRGFRKLNEGIYIFAETEGRTSGKTITSMYELNQGKAENLFQYDNDQMTSEEDSGKENYVIIPSFQETSKDRMGYAIMKDGTQYIHIFDGKEITEIQNPSNEYVSTIVPLKDYVLYLEEIPIEGQRGKYKYQNYLYDIKTKTTKQMDQLNSRFGISYHTQGNEFYYEADNTFNVCSTAAEKLTCRQIDNFYESQYIYTVAAVDEKSDFIFLEDGNNMPHLYLIHWQ